MDAKSQKLQTGVSLIKMWTHGVIFTKNICSKSRFWYQLSLINSQVASPFEKRSESGERHRPPTYSKSGICLSNGIIFFAWWRLHIDQHQKCYVKSTNINVKNISLNLVESCIFGGGALLTLYLYQGHREDLYKSGEKVFGRGIGGEVAKDIHDTWAMMRFKSPVLR